MFESYPRVAPSPCPAFPTRPLLPIFPPPGPLPQPPLPSPPRQPSFDAPYKLSTHIFPAANLRAARDVAVPDPAPPALSKIERQQHMEQIRVKLLDLRPAEEPQAVPRLLWNCVNRYVRQDVRPESKKGLTLFFAHANGFPKEIWEPTLGHLLSSSAGPLIDEIWTWESVQHGDAGLLNTDSLSGVFDWTDNARDILNFLLHYIPSSAAEASLPIHLSRVSQEETESRKQTGFKNRIFVAVGHSYGGCTSTLAALTHPKLFSSLVLIDPVIVKPVSEAQSRNSSAFAQLVLGALLRRESWTSRDEALELFKKSPFFGAWNPDVLRIYVECGLYPSRDAKGHSVVRLKMPGIQEAIVFSETRTEMEVYRRFATLDENIEVHWVVPGKPGAGEFGPPGSTQERVWLRPINASNVRVPNAGHLIPQEAPEALARDLCDFLGRRYRLIKSHL